MEMTRSLSIMVHGPSKAGKSTLASSAPKPMLLLDAEHGHKFLGLRIKYWDPVMDTPPEPDGTWDAAVVIVRKWDDVLRAYAWLNSGQHHFKSLVVDSISEVQAKCLDSIAGNNQVQTQQWGELLRNMNSMMRDMRDLTVHATKPLEAVVLTAMTNHKDGQWRPYLQGQAAATAPYFWDITGFIKVEEFPHPDPSQPPYHVRRLYIGPSADHISGERVGGRLGTIVEQDNMDIGRMLDIVYGASPEAAAPAASLAEAEVATTAEAPAESA